MVFCCFHPIILKWKFFRQFVLQILNIFIIIMRFQGQGRDSFFFLNLQINSCSFLIREFVGFFLCLRRVGMGTHSNHSHTCRSLGKQLIVCKRGRAYSLRANSQMMYNSHSMSNCERVEGAKSIDICLKFTDFSIMHRNQRD